MARKLTTPKAPTGDQATDQAISMIILDIGYDHDATNGGVQINLARTGIKYRLSDYSDAGVPVKHNSRTLFVADWPPALRQAARDLVQMALAHATTEGLLEAGTDQPDL